MNTGFLATCRGHAGHNGHDAIVPVASFARIHTEVVADASGEAAAPVTPHFNTTFEQIFMNFHCEGATS